MSIDRDFTTLALFTHSGDAYAWALPAVRRDGPTPTPTATETATRTTTVTATETATVTFSQLRPNFAANDYRRDRS